MRVAVLLLVVVLSASLLTESEAGWIRRAWRKAKRWVRDNVRVRVSLQRRFRSADKVAEKTTVGDPSLAGCSLTEILHTYDCDVDGANKTLLTPQTEAAMFDTSDANQDHTLDDKEKRTLELMFLAEILEKCLEQRAQTSDNQVV